MALAGWSFAYAYYRAYGAITAILFATAVGLLSGLGFIPSVRVG